MRARAIDHVNLRVPGDRIEPFVDFYRDALGFGVEDLEAYRNGDRPIFSIRLGETCVFHVTPTAPEEFVDPERGSVDHVAVYLDVDENDLREHLDAAGVDVETEAVRKGATGEYPAFYVRDPVGYRVELKADFAD